VTIMYIAVARTVRTSKFLTISIADTYDYKYSLKT
jgi:hypothetical protein